MARVGRIRIASNVLVLHLNLENIRLISNSQVIFLPFPKRKKITNRYANMFLILMFFKRHF